MLVKRLGERIVNDGRRSTAHSIGESRCVEGGYRLNVAHRGLIGARIVVELDVERKIQDKECVGPEFLGVWWREGRTESTGTRQEGPIIRRTTFAKDMTPLEGGDNMLHRKKIDLNQLMRFPLRQS